MMATLVFLTLESRGRDGRGGVEVPYNMSN